MRKVKKIVLILVGLIACIAIGLFIFLQIRVQQAKSQRIHQHSTALVRVAVDDIAIALIKNALTNTEFYKDQSTQDTTGRDALDIGLYIPAYLYFFSIDNRNTDLYSYQRVKDQDKLIAFFLRTLKLDSTAVLRSNDSWFISAHKGKVNIIGDAKNVLLELSVNPEDKAEAIKKIWYDRATVLQQVDELKSINAIPSTGDIVYYNLSNENQLTLDFDNGKIFASAIINSDLWKPTKDLKVRKMDQDDILTFYCNANLGPLIIQHKDLLIKNNIPPDSLVKYYGGYIDMQWKKGSVLQTDTIIAYDYNDNFEMIAKKETREERVPNLVFTVKGSPHMAAYLPEKMFYKFTKHVVHDYLTLSTATDTVIAGTFLPSDDFMMLTYNYDAEVGDFLGWIPQLDKIQRFILKGTSSTISKAHFQGEIDMHNPSLHPLAQLF